MIPNDEIFEEPKIDSDSDTDSALMEDAQSEPISSSITTNGSSSLSDDEQITNSIQNQHEQLQKLIDRTENGSLIQYGKSLGFLDIQYRRQIWPRLINAPIYCPVDYDEKNRIFVIPNDFYSTDQKQIESHRYYGQVRMDVERTLKRFPPNLNDDERLILQEELIVIVIKTLIKQNQLNYYQGYHDICLTFLLVLGQDLCLPFIDTITKSHFKDFMEPTMEKTRDLLSYLMPLINSIHSECAEYMQKGGVGNVMFALSWFITWYSHVLDNFEIILRLYDLFIVSHFLMPIYVAAEIVHFYADEVLLIDCDMPSLHQYLTRLPSELDVQSWNEIIRRALDLFHQHHPDTLDFLNEKWKKKCESMENDEQEMTIRKRRRHSTENDSKDEEKDLNRQEHQGTLPRIVLWGVTLTISGLAIYIWNHTQRTDPTTLISLGDFLAQLYKN